MEGQQQIARLPDATELPVLVVRSATTFARRHKYIAGSYLLGIVVLLFFGSGTQLTMQQRLEYNRIMSEIDLQAEYDASNDYWKARNAYYATKGWFTCDSLCQRNKERMLKAEVILNDIRREGQARMSDAKSVAGLWSEVGVEEAKDSFWQYFFAGKQFAKRQSMWDALFIGMRQMTRGRDETFIEYGLKVLMQVLLNFSLGLLMALLMFVLGLWNIVRSYQPSPVVAVIFFVGASCAAFSFVVSYLLAVYGAAATGVYAVLKLAETSARQQIAAQQRQQRVYDRPHYE